MRNQPLRFALMFSLLLSVLALRPAAQSAPKPETWLDPYRDPSSRLLGEALSTRHAWERLAELGDTYGHRLSGSQALEDAIDWAVAEMRKDGLENVRKEPVRVPHWVRGQESLEITSPRPAALVMLGLGNSIGTPPEGVEAELVVLHSFEELTAAGDRVKGKIVLFNVPFTNYGQTVQFRSTGPSASAKAGAVAMLVRAVGPPGLRTPHTGSLTYAEGAPKIPAAAIPTEDADRLQRMVDRGNTIRLRLKMEAKFLPDADSFNVIGEIRGREKPDEVLVVSGHFDSWDVGAGATDDGGGCIVSWEALRVMKKLKIRPRRTIRVVLWTNEENGLRGGNAYRDRYRDQLASHVLMMESDSGVFRPTGFGFTGSDEGRARVREIATLLRGIEADKIGPSGDGADIGPSIQVAHMPSMSLEVEGNYFLLHHTPADTVDKIDPMDMARASGAIAVMTYVIAEMPDRLK
ncbi:MAG: M20/M25/M40 family metallo-hydrolase [Vicinamibacterales bacterium]